MKRLLLIPLLLTALQVFAEEKSTQETEGSVCLDCLRKYASQKGRNENTNPSSQPTPAQTSTPALSN